ncbi:MAG TPA: glycosyl transferase family 2 [Bacteroidales bacterium]|nr:MAG: glycosyl transferase family 2 [Bacteroidetes bacterium GWF2_33_38]OFY75443.1 MAG: glycosyl transferase family 2 [Bacteroidetes bacterium RIFOXYA12_FULL_33_9]HBF88405.1 glycosyl transferase family 2 [Bacteroidales bacterium]
MISINGLGILFGGFELFSDVSFMINPRDRIGLVGKNGAGKTTLVKVIAGLQGYDSGNISMPTDITLGYLPQQMVCSNNKSVLEETTSAFSEILELEAEINYINVQLSERDDYETDDYLKLIDKLTSLNERFQILGGTSFHADIELTLIGLGFLQSEFSRPTSELSGGWRMRIELAKILLKKPNVLLLDEPTNHLDIESIQWLEDFLKDYAGAVVLISHDRAFLDNVTNRTIEISVGRAYDYKVSYSKYVELRKERREQQVATYENQQKMIEDTEKFIERFRYKSTKSVQVQSRIKQLEKIERVEIDPEDLSAMHFRFPPSPRSGQMVVEIKELTKRYDVKEIIKDIDLIVERGEKIAFVGRNGEGKTTLSRIIVGELECEGLMRIGHNVKIGYFAQNQDEIIDENKTVLETIDAVAVGDVRQRMRDILGAFLFSGEDVDKKVKVLSGGERSRLAMAKLLLEPVNLLVLDEPTNHLDMRSKDILKQALQKYDGTVLIVSHDRDFLDGLTTKIYEFKNQKIKQHLCGIYEFLAKKKLDSLKELERKAVQNNIKKTDSITDSKQQYLDKKEYEKTLRKINNQIKECEDIIAKLEAELANLNEILSNNPSDNTSLYEQYQDIQQQIASKMKRWEELQYELEITEDQK